MDKGEGVVAGTWVFVLGVLGAVGIVVFDAFQWLHTGSWVSTVLADLNPGFREGCAVTPGDWVGLWEVGCWATCDLSLAIIVVGLASVIAFVK